MILDEKNMKNYIKRTIEESVEKISETFPVVMITGPRQVGKTTLLNKIRNEKELNYVSLDDLKARALAIEDPELFLRTYEYPLIIDEFQYAPNLLSYIKIIVDEKRLEAFSKETKCNGLFYLTGSQAFQTMKNVSESLAGRVGILDLYGLSNREIDGKQESVFIPIYDKLKEKEFCTKLSTHKLYERILKGSYPELYNDKNIYRKRYKRFN